MSKYVAALDIGTTGTRCIIFDLKGNKIGWDYEEWTSFYPTPVMVEQDANMWWKAVKKTIVNSIENAKIDKDNIISVAITNQRETIVPVNNVGEPLYHAIVWQDRRTTDECSWIKENIGIDKIYNTTGLTVDPYFSGSKILWFKNHKPEIYSKTHKFLLVHDFILYKLTGKYITDHSNASRTMLFDITSRKWSDEIGSKMEIDLDKMPEALPSGKEVGNIISSDTGFSTKTKIITGGGDQQCAALGVGVIKPGRMKCTTGTGSFILGYLDKPTFDSKKRVLCSCAAIPGKWVQEASIFTSGAVLRWFRDNIGAEERIKAENALKEGKTIDPYDLMTAKAEKSPIGAKGLILIPHLIGAGTPYWNPHARGVLFGLALGHTTGDMYRAVLEGVAMEVKKSLNVFKSLGLNPVEMRITGGASRSSLWNQIMADILGIPCGRGELEESTAIGASILASYGAGEFNDLEKAAENMIKINKIWNPNPSNTERYAELFEISEKLYEKINSAGLYDDLAKFSI
ncbi:MAG: FGGY-family carbohydrate kinase [Promethearchaeota archaeon]